MNFEKPPAEPGPQEKEKKVEDILGREQFDWEKEGYFDKSEYEKLKTEIEASQKEGRPTPLETVLELANLRAKKDEIEKGDPIHGKMYTAAEKIKLEKIRDKFREENEGVPIPGKSYTFAEMVALEKKRATFHRTRQRLVLEKRFNSSSADSFIDIDEVIKEMNKEKKE